MIWATAYARCAKVCHKKIDETDAIFNQLAVLHQRAREDKTTLRVSIDAKATVKVGPFSRHGRSRVIVNGVDHDFKALESLTPFGILLPDQDEVYMYFAPSGLTADFIADC